MGTRGERRALTFLAAVVLLGAATRAFRARRVTVATGELDRQIAAVETTVARVHGRGRGAANSRLKPLSQGKVDMDSASANDLERLPGIGPALAKRIVSNRTDEGAFGCLAALRGVKGIGPALIRRLDSLVVFGGTPRPSCG